jgi:DNA primase
MPLNWSQVRAGLDPQRYTIRTAADALAKTKPWADYCDAERPLALWRTHEGRPDIPSRTGCSAHVEPDGSLARA